MLKQRDVRLVVADDAEHVLRLHRRRKALGLTERGRGFFDASALRQHDTRQRVEQREIAAVARGMQRRRRLRDVLADDRRVADLLVAEPELVVREADGFGIVRQLGLAQRAAEQRDRARLVALGKRDAAMQPPERREERGRKIVARRIGRPSKRRGRLRDVVAHQPGLGERASEADFVFVLEPGGLQRLREHADRVGMPAALQRRSRARQRRLKGDGDHGREYTTPRGKIERLNRVLLSLLVLAAISCGGADAPPRSDDRTGVAPRQPSHLFVHLGSARDELRETSRRLRESSCSATA